MWGKDAPINQSDLAGESSTVPVLHSKWLNHYTDEKLLMRRVLADHRRLYKVKWEYYTGKLSQDEITERGWEPIDHKILKADIQIYLDADDELTMQTDKLEFQKVKVEFIEKVLNAIIGRQWNIKGTIDWRKFTNGE